ncbi:uncharacterized protein HaLaN_22590 [Haematococcus lacustris]|uniref:Uncharacterized protein n=1 Tax=Haematococcus lacustris TaxID=44745 RepID=A0A699ZPH2_HAELA|nr:uncharacterized protein HaLaN_22590 [Haematococcus lacustris]
MSTAYLDVLAGTSIVPQCSEPAVICQTALSHCALQGFFVQMQAARVGVASGKNLAELCRHEYPRVPSLTLWVMTEVAIIGSDVQVSLNPSLAAAAKPGSSSQAWQQQPSLAAASPGKCWRQLSLSARPDPPKAAATGCS